MWPGAKPSLLNPYQSPPILSPTCQPINHFCCQLIDNPNPPPHSVLLPLPLTVTALSLEFMLVVIKSPISSSHITFQCFPLFVGIFNFPLLDPILSSSTTVYIFFFQYDNVFLISALPLCWPWVFCLAVSLSVGVIQAVHKAALAALQKKQKNKKGNLFNHHKTIPRTLDRRN